MGWFKQKIKKEAKPGLIFVPEWGWVGSKLQLKQLQKHLIFVPEWGWVGSADFNRNFKKSSNDIDTINNCKQTVNYTYPITQTNI